MNTKDTKTDGQLLSEKITFTTKNSWELLSPDERSAAMCFADSYKSFLNNCKTEKNCITYFIDLLEQYHFRDIWHILDNPLSPGTCIYQNIKDRAIMCAIIGEKQFSEGINIIGTHIDSPRIDLKANPFYEESELLFLDTHYYGGIKYYQWTAIPLEMHGSIIDKNGVKKNISIGENENDPVFTITDLLPHLAADQMKKNATDFINGEGLDILAGSEPYHDDKIADKVKLNVLNILHEKYKITERSFVSAEISFVPAFKARDIGFDRSMIGAYGHDDKCCSYAALRAALLFADPLHIPKKTLVCFLTGKEEERGYRPHIKHFENFIHSLNSRIETNKSGTNLSEIFCNSYMLTADVFAAFDPNYADVFDKKNATFTGKGIALSKSEPGNFTDIQFFQKVQYFLDKNNIPWQYGSWGKVDKGGGSTIAPDFANLGIEVLGCGIPILSMHSPFEILSKIDLWTAYKVYKLFFEENQ